LTPLSLTISLSPSEVSAPILPLDFVMIGGRWYLVLLKERWKKREVYAYPHVSREGLGVGSRREMREAVGREGGAGEGQGVSLGHREVEEERSLRISSRLT
jgi:hypothetical protein